MNKKKLFNPGLTEREKMQFESLVKANMKRAYFVALGFLGSEDDAAEISQEAFIRAYRNFKKFDKTKNFFTWYYKILKNLCLNFIRDTKTKKNGFLEVEELNTTVDDPAEYIEKKELHEKLEKALIELDFEDREIIVLKEFQQMSYKEIAEMLKIPVGTVMSKLFYARKKLAKKLKGII